MCIIPLKILFTNQNSFQLKKVKSIDMYLIC